MKTEEGIKFTDENYATKEEIVNFYNSDNISDIINKVKDYRSNFNYQTNLRTIDDRFYFICLTKKLMNDAYGLERLLMHNEISFLKLSPVDQQTLMNELKLSALLACCKNVGVNPHQNTLRKIVDDSLSSLPTELYIIQAYSNALIQATKIKEITIETIYQINKLLILDDMDAEVKLRSSEIENYNNPLLQTAPEKIKESLLSLVELLNDESIPLLVRGIVIIYYFLSVRPFEYSNEETAAILAKAFLHCHFLENTSFLLDFESLAFSKSQWVFKRLKSCQDNDDLTYACFSFLPFLIDNARKLTDKISDLILYPTIAANQDIEVIDMNKKALPSFPIANSTEEIEEITAKLLKTYPLLKKRQAHFYAGHCTIGLHYTVNDFKEAENTVYETARTSMDDLANKGFYKKDKFNKKFVYSPIPIKEE